MLDLLEEAELLTPGKTEIIEEFLANGSNHDEDFAKDVQAHLHNFKGKFIFVCNTQMYTHWNPFYYHNFIVLG